MSITLQDVRDYRIDLSAKLKKALDRSGLDQTQVGEKFGRSTNGAPVTQTRISQLVNCKPGCEDRSEELLRWFKEALGIDCL